VAADPAIERAVAAGAFRYRRNVRRLTADQLAVFRTAVHKIKGLSDDRGYQHWAGIHGLPLPMYCQHGGAGPMGSRLFFPWHRAYLHFFELALQDQVAEATLPWWNWTQQDVGVPDEYAQTTIDGQPNPLAGAAVQPSARQSGQPTKTTRSPGDPADLPTVAEIGDLLTRGDFFDFSSGLEDIHNRIHGWTGGTMGIIPWAAYDPIFWAHHTMIDRLWRLWQARHPGASPPPSLLGQALPPFPMTVADTLHVHHLGYDYAGSTSHVGGVS
jgi:tyrosinase